MWWKDKYKNQNCPMEYPKNTLCMESRRLTTNFLILIKILGCDIYTNDYFTFSCLSFTELSVVNCLLLFLCWRELLQSNCLCRVIIGYSSKESFMEFFKIGSEDSPYWVCSVSQVWCYAERKAVEDCMYVSE